MILTVLFDPTAPGPIGGTTPSTGAFTSLSCSTYTSSAGMTFTPAANTPCSIVLSGASGVYTVKTTAADGIACYDVTALQGGVGGGMYFGGNYTGSTTTTWAAIRGPKENSTDGEYGGYLSLLTRAHGASHAEVMRLTSGGNVGIGTSSFGASAAQVLGIGNGTAPSTSPANMVQIWAEDVAASSELRVRDEAGNVTTLSPHAKDAPATMYDRGVGLDRIVRSANYYVGEIEWTNESRMARISQMTPNERALLSESQREVYRIETFAEYNTRRQNEPGHTPLVSENWDTNQDAITADSVRAISDWEAMPVDSRQPVKPKPYTKKTKPTWVL